MTRASPGSQNEGDDMNSTPPNVNSSLPHREKQEVEEGEEDDEKHLTLQEEEDEEKKRREDEEEEKGKKQKPTLPVGVLSAGVVERKEEKDADTKKNKSLPSSVDGATSTPDDTHKSILHPSPASILSDTADHKRSSPHSSSFSSSAFTTDPPLPPSVGDLMDSILAPWDADFPADFSLYTTTTSSYDLPVLPSLSVAVV